MKQKHNNILKAARLLALVVLMAIGVGLKGWGQQYTISPQDGKTFPQNDVPTIVETIYVEPNSSRTLQVYDYQNYWYVRWYRYNGIKTNIVNITAPSGSSLRRTSNSDSYFWFHDMNGTNQNSVRINYNSNQVTFPDSVFCDLSFNVDGLGITPTSYNIKEPTIGKRYKFIIKSADEIRTRLNSLDDDAALDTFRITVPYGATYVNLQMNMYPQNYFWETNNRQRQGEEFSYSINGGRNRTSTNKLIELGQTAITRETTVKVYASDGNNNSPCLALYIITPQENSGFKTEAQIVNDPDRNPGKYQDKYKQIGVVDFDFDNVISRSSLNAGNNMSSEQINPANTTYSFANPLLDWINYPTWMPEDAYGLYRSANVEDVSERKGYNVSNWGKEYASNNRFREGYKTYGWYFTNISSLSNKVLYDRTYYNTGGISCGYFCYLNASTQAGRVVNVDINGIICPNTELVVTAWMADITNAEILPNVNLLFWGRNSETGATGILHRFSSGRMTLDYENDRANWKQLCYKIIVSKEMLSDYDKFFIEIQNNAEGTSGADYAIDDIRIYRSLPNINVIRENACDASTLLLSSDYATILRNMGWSEGQLVSQERTTPGDGGYDYKDLDYRKYRYGLMGENHEFKNSVVGNVYFAFWDSTKVGTNEEWVTVNKRALGVSTNAAKSIRVPVSTVLSKSDGEGATGYEFYTESREEAMVYEQIINLRAVADYNKDIKGGLYDGLNSKLPEDDKYVYIPIDSIGTPGNDDFNQEKYQTAIESMYHRLNIPRLRCPWYNKEEGRLYLSIIDVNNTDLKYRGQDKTDENPEGASGEYHVISFKASEVIGQEIVNPRDPCSLISPFTVQPAATILIETAMGEPETAACAGSLRRITATLEAYDKENNNAPIDLQDAGIDYLFDWYLDDLQAYELDSIDNSNVSIKTLLEVYRDDQKDQDIITVEDANKWSGGRLGANAKYRLVTLLESGLLLTGSKGGSTFDIELPNTDRIVAIPYVFMNDGVDSERYTFCSDRSELSLPVEELNIPKINPGFPGITELDGGAPLRLGLRNMEKEVTLKIPFTDKGLEMFKDAHHLGVNGEPEISFRKGTSATLTKVGNVSGLYIPNGYNENSKLATITINWTIKPDTVFEEGKEYELLFPFVQYKNDTEILSTQCDGLASLRIRVVPEYLTWQGDGSDVWYSDGNWKQSTEKELYMDNQQDTDANGNDDVSDAFAPLYFTKITIPGEKELSLLNPTYVDDNNNNKTITNLGVGYTIQYDMAVDTVLPTTEGGQGSIKVVPYYINKVDQIYFKPGATLLNQHLLTYNKARVDFEMTKGQPYWMSSPLKDVYAGDMYAPAGTGRQETPAFEDITYDDGTNSRWGLPFYQKAWNKAVSYKTEAGEVNVSVVQSNWSIEYNDVWVPYTVGKGFYSRVENKNANNNVLVRLPKEDTDYTYEKPKTKGLSTFPTGGKDDSGKLHTDGTTDGTITLDLSSVDGDGNHFLIGNPYMAYLDMSKFFNEGNKAVLGEKYWIIDNEGNASVGTPDVVWGDGMKSGYIAPMQAFFVEHKDYTPNETKSDTEVPTPAVVTSNINMTVSQDEATNQNPGTRAFKATNPQLTILAKGAEGKSVSFVVQSDFAENVYMSDEDAVALLDSELKIPMVYTVAGNCAAAVNKVKDMQNIPLGVYAEEDEEVEVTIEGMSQFVDSLYLHDALTGKSVLLDGDIYTLRVNGENHGRYTITTKGGITVESNICVYSPSSNNLMIAASPSETLEQVRVFDMSGRMVENRVDLESSNCRLRVASGIYIVYAKTEAGETKVKVRVK